MGWLTGLSTLSCCGKPSMLSSKKRRLCKRILWKKTVSFINTARHAHMSRCSHSISVRNPILQAARRWMVADAALPRRATGEEPFSFHVITLAPQRYVLYRRFHHMITDGRSAEEVMRRIAAYYNALASGGVIPEFANCNFSLLYENDIKYRDSSRFSSDQAFGGNILPLRRRVCRVEPY